MTIGKFALIPVNSKCFELVPNHNKDIVPAHLDQHQFAYCVNTSPEDDICVALNTAFSHLERDNTYVWMLFVDYSSVFNTIMPNKLHTLQLTYSICNWILDFLINSPQTVRLQAHNFHFHPPTGVPQGCVLSPLLYFRITRRSKSTQKTQNTKEKQLLPKICGTDSVNCFTEACPMFSCCSASDYCAVFLH